MCAVYAFMRYCDDSVDESGTVEDKRGRLQVWRSALDEAYTDSNGVSSPLATVSPLPTVKVSVHSDGSEVWFRVDLPV